MAHHGGELVVIQPGAAQTFVIPRETHWLDDVQTKTGVSAQADDIAGIWRDFWFE
ncbi:hypothetical protein D3C87_1693920 [compost metagenome]